MTYASLLSDSIICYGTYFCEDENGKKKQTPIDEV